MPPTILHTIHNASIEEVEAAGIFWKVTKIASADLARVGFAALAMATPEQADTVADDDADEQKLGDMLKGINAEQAAKVAALQDATVCAGLMAAGNGDGNWEDLSCVLDQRREDPDKGVLWVGSLPAGVTEVLFSAIMNLSTDKGAAAERLATFRSAAGSAPRTVDGGDQTGQIPARNSGT